MRSFIDKYKNLIFIIAVYSVLFFAASTLKQENTSRMFFNLFLITNGLITGYLLRNIEGKDHD